MNANLDKIRQKIAALHARAKDKASTESEAEMAMKHAAKLMNEHSITFDDLAQGRINREDFVAKAQAEDRKRVHEVDYICGNAIGRFCDVVAVNDGGSGAIIFIGYSVDVELAIYIRDLVLKTGEYEWKRYHEGFKMASKGMTFTHGKTIRKEFFGAYCARIRERLDALKGEMMEANEHGARLVVMKQHLVRAAFEDFMNADGGSLKDNKAFTFTYTKASIAGEEAGNKVRFHREFNGTNKQKRIKG